MTARGCAESMERPDARLEALIADFNTLPEERRTVRGKVFSGHEVIRAIPDIGAFLAEMSQMKNGRAFELNEEGQLVMLDEDVGPEEGYSQAKKRQKRVVYRDADGAIQVMTGDDYFVEAEEGDLRLSEAALRISPESILMERGLPTVHMLNPYKHPYRVGEFARMSKDEYGNTINSFWAEDFALKFPEACYTSWDNPWDDDDDDDSGCMHARVMDTRGLTCKSRRVVRVKLDLQF